MAAQKPKTCEACRVKPAIWQHDLSGSWLCLECGPYRTGVEHGRALGGLEMLVYATSELVGSGLDADHVVALLTHALKHDANQADVRPRGATVEDPRPFMALLTPIASDHPDVRS